jgi:hypothetical protein
MHQLYEIRSASASPDPTIFGWPARRLDQCLQLGPCDLRMIQHRRADHQLADDSVRGFMSSLLLGVLAHISSARFNKSGSRAILVAIRRASSGVSTLACIAFGEGRAAVDPRHRLAGRVPDGLAAGRLVGPPRGRETAFRFGHSAESCPGFIWRFPENDPEDRQSLVIGWKGLPDPLIRFGHSMAP